jgi:hypothetical protein
MGTVEELSPAAYAETDGKTPLTKEFGTFVKETLKKWKVPGMSLAVIDGEDIYAEVGAHDNLIIFINRQCQQY